MVGTQVGKSGNTIKYTKVTVITGTLTSAGISNFKEGFIFTSKTGDTNNEMMAVNGCRVYTEQDKLAAVSTYSLNQAAPRMVSEGSAGGSMAGIR